MLAQILEIAGAEVSMRSLGSSVSTTACHDALTRALWQASSPHSAYHSSVTSGNAVGESRRVWRTFVPSASRSGLAVKAGDATPVRVMAVYVRFDVELFAGSSSGGDGILFMPTILVPLSILSRRLSADGEPQDLDEYMSVNEQRDNPIYTTTTQDSRRAINADSLVVLTVYDARLQHSTQTLATLSQTALQYHSCQPVSWEQDGSGTSPQQPSHGSDTSYTAAAHDRTAS